MAGGVFESQYKISKGEEPTELDVMFNASDRGGPYQNKSSKCRTQKLVPEGIEISERDPSPGVSG